MLQLLSLQLNECGFYRFKLRFDIAPVLLLFESAHLFLNCFEALAHLQVLNCEFQLQHLPNFRTSIHQLQIFSALSLDLRVLRAGLVLLL